MPITASAVSLNVADPAASAEFAKRHLGFREDMSADGFVSLSRADAGFNLIFLRTGLATFKPDSPPRWASALRVRRAEPRRRPARRVIGLGVIRSGTSAVPHGVNPPSKECHEAAIVRTAGGPRPCLGLCPRLT